MRLRTSERGTELGPVGPYQAGLLGWGEARSSSGKPSMYARVSLRTDAKANLSLVTFKARWFFKRTFTLPNKGGDDEPADELGVLEVFKPKNVFDKIDAGLARTILLAIDKGVIVENKPRLATDDGARIDPTPDLYTLTRRGKTTRWAGTVVQEHVECADKEAQKLLNVWVKNGVLKEVDVTTSTSKGKSRKGLRVNMSKLPGTTIDEA